MKLTRFRSFIKEWYNKYSFFKSILYPFKYLYDFYRFRVMPDKIYITRQFKIMHNYDLNLYKPITLNERIQWLKLYDRSPIHTQCADKIAVRKYVEEIIGADYLIPLLFTTNNYKEISQKRLPDYPCIIKANHNSGGTFIVKDKNQQNFKEIQQLCKKWLNEKFYIYSKEWQYKNIKPTLLVEKLLTNSYGEVPYDYKIHCFNGKVKFIQVDIDRFTNHKRNFYDRDWNMLPFTWSLQKDGEPLWPNGNPVSKPDKLELILQNAEKLAHRFYYVRIDFYLFENNLYFGEITFHHGSGFEIFSPIEWDIKLGKLLNLPIDEQ